MVEVSRMSRESILNAIRSALGNDDSSEEEALPREYRAEDDLSREERLDLFVERVRDYKAVVQRISSATLHDAIAQALARRGVHRLVVPADLPDAWLPPGISLLRDPGLTIEQLESSDGVLTGCASGVAQTGTILLDAGPLQGRRVLTLLPDYHLCIIRDDQVVGLVPEAIAQLRSNATRPITLISGPSATSDIELNRVEGVHGPRTLEVLLLSPAG
jgi:L-lactate dehydrogenase complex protein LldG